MQILRTEQIDVEQIYCQICFCNSVSTEIKPFIYFFYNLQYSKVFQPNNKFDSSRTSVREPTRALVPSRAFDPAATHHKSLQLRCLCCCRCPNCFCKPHNLAPCICNVNQEPGRVLNQITLRLFYAATLPPHLLLPTYSWKINYSILLYFVSFDLTTLLSLFFFIFLQLNSFKM